ncbi:MAG: hypothetical protein ACJA2Q_001429 [Pseudohongiellaceae bacterium]|jgi:hypothetical protein
MANSQPLKDLFPILFDSIGTASATLFAGFTRGLTMIRIKNVTTTYHKKDGRYREKTSLGEKGAPISYQYQEPLLIYSGRNIRRHWILIN